jgi:hypothetical protein
LCGRAKYKITAAGKNNKNSIELNNMKHPIIIKIRRKKTT